MSVNGSAPRWSMPTVPNAYRRSRVWPSPARGRQLPGACSSFEYRRVASSYSCRHVGAGPVSVARDAHGAGVPVGGRDAGEARVERVVVYTAAAGTLSGLAVLAACDGYCDRARGQGLVVHIGVGALIGGVAGAVLHRVRHRASSA